MNDTIPTPSRRNVIRAIGGSAVAAGVGGAALLATTGSATAAFESDTDIGTVETNDGRLTHLSIYGDSTVNWEGFDTEATQFSITSEVDVVDESGNSFLPDDRPQEINDTGVRDLTAGDWGGDGESYSGPGKSGSITSDVGLHGNGSPNPDTDWAIIQAEDYEDPYGLPQSPVAASDIDSAPADGESTTYYVKLLSTYHWYDGNASSTGTDASGHIFSETFTATYEVDVTNLEPTADSTAGDGESGATAE